MSRRTNNVYKPKMTAFLIATIMLVLVVIVILMSTVLILSAGKGETTTTPAYSWTPSYSNPVVTTTKAPVVTTTPATTTTKNPDVPDTPVIPGTTIVVKDLADSKIGSLVLVDKNHFYTRDGLVPRGSMNTTTASLLGFGALSGGTGNYKLSKGSMYLDLDARSAFNKMMEDLAAVAESGDVQVRNAYYYSADLTAITDQDSLETVEHSTGFVLDLEINKEGKIYPLNFPSMKAKFYDWLLENCWKYGFIHLRDTGSYSTFRYIGISHAAMLHKDAQLNFQNYLTMLTAYNIDNKLKVTDSTGAEWWIYYVKAENNAVNVPVYGDESVYQISGNNVGGFVVAINSSKLAK